MSRARNLLQAAVLKSNRFFPFSCLNQTPYWMALHSFLRVCRTFPEIRGVYLRHGMAEKDWIPGVSDIDLTVAISGGLSPEEELRFLVRLREKHVHYRRLFPMLADVAILPEDYLPAWVRFGIQGFDARRWKPVSGGPAPHSSRDRAERKDAIDDALYRFFDRMLAWYFAPPSYLTLRRIQRVADRILRHAPFELQATDDPALLVARVLLGLDRWIGEVREAEASHAGSGGNEDAVMVLGEICLVVPGGRLNEEDLRARLLRLRNRATVGGMRVRVATHRILRYWLRVWRPSHYHDWIAEAQTVSGSNVLNGIEPPTEESYIRSLLNTTHSVLSFPQYEIVVLQRDPRWFAGEAFRSLVARGWYLRLYLEQGIQQPLPARAMREVRRHYPECVENLAEIQQMAATDGCDTDSLRLRAFCLLKETAEAVNRALSSAPLEEQDLRIYAVHG